MSNANSPLVSSPYLAISLTGSEHGKGQTPPEGIPQLIVADPVRDNPDSFVQAFIGAAPALHKFRCKDQRDRDDTTGGLMKLKCFSWDFCTRCVRPKSKIWI
jgi:hypothetical protein